MYNHLINWLYFFNEKVYKKLIPTMKKTIVSMIYLVIISLCPNFVSADGSVRILTTPEDAQVLVDRELKAINTPVSIKLPNGKYRVTVRHKEDSRWFDVLITDGITILKEFDFNASEEIGILKPSVNKSITEGQGLRNLFALETGATFKYQMTSQGKNQGYVHILISEKSINEKEDTYELELIIFSEYYESNQKIVKPKEKYRFRLVVSATSASVTDFYKLPSSNSQKMKRIHLRFELSQAELPFEKGSKFVFSIITDQFNMKESGQVISDSTERVIAGKVMKNILKTKFKLCIRELIMDAELYLAYGWGPIRLDFIDKNQEIINVELTE
jgi:hypothetical protein